MKPKKLLWESWGLDVVRQAFSNPSIVNKFMRSGMPNSAELLAIKHFNERSYLVAKDFYASLHDVDLKLNPKHVPLTHETVYIQFPQLIQIDNRPGEFIGGAFAGVFDMQTMKIYDESGYARKKTFLGMAYILDKYGKHAAGDCIAAVLSLDYPTLEESWGSYERSSTDGSRDVQAIMKNLLKLLVYFDSGTPDLRHLRKPSGPGERREHTAKYGAFYEHDVFHVGYEWKKPRLYHVDGTRVRSHFRWQPCGPGREQVKLILIDEHERHFKRGEVT
jgi:hypothetical protein